MYSYVKRYSDVFCLPEHLCAQWDVIHPKPSDIQGVYVCTHKHVRVWITSDALRLARKPLQSLMFLSGIQNIPRLPLRHWIVCLDLTQLKSFDIPKTTTLPFLFDLNMINMDLFAQFSHPSYKYLVD